jgi:hypothetical protein
MAYGKKYIFSAISKSGLTYTAEMWENGYTGPEYNVNSGMSPFVLTCAGSGDDPFQPILPTIFNIRADFTDFTGPYPDLVSTDDRKYYVRFSANGGTYFIWQGFVLMDSIAIPFTTGRNFVDIICVDGLGLLKTVPYAPITSPGSIGEHESLLQIIRNCLQNINYPIQYYINSAINYYASGQTDTESYLRNSYIYPVTWTNDDYTFKNCYDILQDICVSHGVQLYQSGGEWWFTSVNERASDTLRVFRTDGTSSTDTLSNVSINRTIKPYQSNGNIPYYFIDNNQTKIIKKGFNAVEIVNELDYPKNFALNGNMTSPVGVLPLGWDLIFIGSGGTQTFTTQSGIYGATTTAAGISSQYGYLCDGYISQGDTVTIKFQGKCNTVDNITMLINIYEPGIGGAQFYYTTTSVGGFWTSVLTDYSHNVTSTQLESYSITLPPAPITGKLGIIFKVLPTSPTSVFVANLKATAVSSLASKEVLYNQTASNQYKKSITIPIGGQFPATNKSQIQSILSDTDDALQDYTRFSGGPTYTTLSKLLFSQFYNIYSKPNINLQLTQYNLFTGSGVIGLLQNFGVEDPTSIINITDARFVMSNSTFDYVNNTLSGTALEISNEILPYTLLTTIPVTPPLPCNTWLNNSEINSQVNYVACDGTVYSDITLTPGQSICAKGTPETISGPLLIQGSQC